MSDNGNDIHTDEYSESEKTKRIYEKYVINDPEEMDYAPDAGDMFDDDELYGTDDDYDGAVRVPVKRTGITGRMLVILWALFVLLAAAYVYFFFAGGTSLFEDTTGRDNTVNIEIPADASYSLCQVDEINRLISNYLQALADADETTLKSLVTDSSEFDDMRSVELTAKYITAYSETTCYMVPGLTDGSYVVYELSYISIKDVDSAPLDIRSFYVEKQDDGTYLTDNSMTDDESAYMNDVTDSDDIQDIYKHVKENNDYISRTDETFREFQDIYK